MINGYVGGTSFTNVLSNDRLNGVAVIPDSVNVTFVSSSYPKITLNGTNVNVGVGTPAGNYTLIYRICEKLNPTNCDTAIVKVPVSAAPIVANVDYGTMINGYTGGTSLTNVLSNDKLNGVAVIPDSVNITFVSSSYPKITLNGTNVDVGVGTPAGNYTLIYRICEKLNPTNCDTAIVKVPVSAAPIVANVDYGTTVNGFTGGTSLTNVLSNDKLNGVAVIPDSVNITFVSSSDPKITLSGANVNVAPGTAAGNYTLIYRICEKLNPANCDTAIVKVPVSAAPIEAIVDYGSVINGLTGGTSFTNVLVNDKLNGSTVDPAKVTTTFVSSSNANITLNGTNVVVAPSTPAGNYTLIYRICEKLNPSNCDTAIVKVPVVAPPIVAIVDYGTPVVGYSGGTSVVNILTNDLLNGVAFNPVNVNLTFVSSTNAGITLNGSSVIVAAGTPAGK